MLDFSITDHAVFIAFWLCFIRLFFSLMSIPLLDDQAIPLQVKILLTIIISYVIFPFVKNSLLQEIHIFGRENIWILAITHSIIGLAIGMVVKFIMNIYLSVGSIITQNIGFAAMRYFDPNFVQNVGPFEKLIKWCVIVTILSLGAYVPMFKGIITSFRTLSINSLLNLETLSASIIGLVQDIFMAVLVLASPIIFANLLQMITLGIVARAVPQLNVLMVSFVINIGIGLFVFSLVLVDFQSVSIEIYEEMLGKWYKLIHTY